MTNSSKALIAALACFGLYATHDALIKFLGGSYPPVQVLFFVSLFGFPLIAIQLVRDTTPGTLRPQKPGLVLLRSGIVMLGGVLGFTAFSRLPLTQVYAMIFSAPLLITLMAIPVLGERVGWRRGLAVVIGLVGVTIALDPAAAGGVGWNHLYAVGAAICIACIGLTTRLIGTQERTAILMLYPMIGNLVLTGAMLPGIYVPVELADLAVLAVIATLAWWAGLLMIRAYSLGEAGSVAPMQYSQIIWAIFYGTVFFNETPGLRTMVGCVIIIGSGVYIALRESGGGHSAQTPVIRADMRSDANLLRRLRPSRRR